MSLRESESGDSLGGPRVSGRLVALPDKFVRVPNTSQVLVGSRHVHTLWLIFERSFSHPSGSLARVFLIADSSVLDGNRLPHWGQPCGLSTPARVDLRGGPTDRLEPACGCNSSAPSINSCGIASLILLCFCSCIALPRIGHRGTTPG
jgi:hypothetical protein